VLVDFGDRVRVGQVLVEIEREELMLQVDTTESALNSSFTNLRSQGERRISGFLRGAEFSIGSWSEPC
jgi:multidrug resistance efflux pump